MPWLRARAVVGRAAGKSMSGHRHAPRGPLKARDPINDPHPISQCKATNNRGERCKRAPIPGGTVCRYHGGAAPQVKAKAEQRLLRLQVPAIARLEELMTQKEFPSTAYQAVRDVLDRTMGKPAETVQTDHSGEIVIRHELGD